MYIDHNSLAVGLYQYIAMEQYRLFFSQPEGDESEKKGIQRAWSVHAQVHCE